METVVFDVISVVAKDSRGLSLGDNIKQWSLGPKRVDTLQDKASCAHQKDDEHGLGKDWLQLELVRCLESCTLCGLYWRSGGSLKGFDCLYIKGLSHNVEKHPNITLANHSLLSPSMWIR